jgi:tetratricopeptide (TPR) repeat protein
MNKNKTLDINEIFILAVKNHQQNKTDIAQNLYNQVLKINPNHIDAYNNLGIIFKNLGKNEKAINCYQKAIAINPNYANAYSNLGLVFKNLGENQKAINCYQKAITINPNLVDAYNNLGIIFEQLGQNQKAINCYQKAITINPNHTNTHNNLGVIFKKLGQNQDAINCYQKAIAINPNDVITHNNLGVILDELGHSQKARNFFEKAIKLNPNYTETYWNFHGLSENTEEALFMLKKLYKINNKHKKAKIMIAALEGYKGNLSKFNEITSSESEHPITRSMKWVFSLSKLPNIFFNRWLFFNSVIKLTDNSRPFYEFGVWNGISFKYLINTFKKGFGFDTFSGLPEDWHHEPKGSYSSFKGVPKVKGGEFIIGKFEDTLQDFFAKERPKASLINFDADLYSSTLCALNHSIKVIDEKTILIFDEFLNNDNWEEDEYKALNEFCDNVGCGYDVIAISLFTKQVAVKLK